MDDSFLFPVASKFMKPTSGILWCSEDSLSAADFIGAISFYGTPSCWDTPPTICHPPKYSRQGGPYPHFIPIKSQARPPGGVWDHHWLSMVSGFRSSREPSVPKVQSGSKQAMATSPVIQLCMPTAIKLVKHRFAWCPLFRSLGRLVESGMLFVWLPGELQFVGSDAHSIQVTAIKGRSS